MNDLFIAAVDSLLELYGSQGTLKFPDNTVVNVKVSPLFPSKLISPQEKGGAMVSFDASVLVQAIDHSALHIDPFRTHLFRGNEEYTICTAVEVPGNAVELGIKR